VRSTSVVSLAVHERRGVGWEDLGSRSWRGEDGVGGVHGTVQEAFGVLAYRSWHGVCMSRRRLGSTLSG